VKLRSRDGVEGIGFCYVGTAGARMAQAAIQDLLAPMLLGQESTRVEGLWEEMYRETLLHGRTGTVMRTISILDIALWDLNARSAELPLYRYLGCCAKDKVPAYASGGYYIDGKTPRDLGDEVAAYVRAGFRAL
jgi:L-alanine-DL-glutamate epimerase-like enolase superfamily enzyme